MNHGTVFKKNYSWWAVQMIGKDQVSGPICTPTSKITPKIYPKIPQGKVLLTWISIKCAELFKIMAVTTIPNSQVGCRITTKKRNFSKKTTKQSKYEYKSLIIIIIKIKIMEVINVSSQWYRFTKKKPCSLVS